MRTPKFKPGDAVRVAMPVGADEIVDGIVISRRVLWTGVVDYVVLLDGSGTPVHEIPECALTHTERAS